jgi:hypothetical protein
LKNEIKNEIKNELKMRACGKWELWDHYGITMAATCGLTLPLSGAPSGCPLNLKLEEHNEDC